MISTMTTSENFPLSSQSRCGTSPYKSILQSSYVSPAPTSARRNPSTADETLLRTFSKDYQQFGKGSKEEKEESEDTFSEFELPPSIICNSISVSGGGVVSPDIPENELMELFEQIELDDVPTYDPSKPLKIDPNILKLDLSSFSNHDRTFSESAKDQISLRASHHLSGGGILTDSSSQEDKNRFCKLSGGGVLSNENVFSFNQFNDSEYRLSNFLNPVSPSSPLTFDLTPHSEVKNVTDAISSDSESTNPFKNFMRDRLAESETVFPPTNPFGFSSSSLLQNSNSARNSVYENVTLPQKSFSQCSTRPASPILKSSSDESSISNPFLINRASPEPRAPPPPPLIHQFFINEANFQKAPNPSSFIFAVPVFPIFQHNITNSSTQTNEIPAEVKTVEPVYQNITSQLKKFIQRNDHSEYDLQCLKTTVKDLRNSGWYYENVSWQESVVLLKDTEPGTFLIRDSSDPNFLFSLSVQTSRGPTSVRLHYVNGQFRLDAEEKLIPHMPSFNSVVELIDYYIENTVKNKLNNRCKRTSKKNGKNKLQKSKEQVWIDSQGNIYSNILLVKPLYKKENFSTLQHLARLTINRSIKSKMNAKVKPDFRVTPVYESTPFQDCSSFPINFDNFCPILSIDALPLPVTLLEYLKDYPYCH